MCEYISWRNAEKASRANTTRKRLNRKIEGVSSSHLITMSYDVSCLLHSLVAVLCERPEFFFDAQELVVLSHTV